MVVRMISHRSLNIVFFALISAVVLLITAKRLDQGSWDTGSFTTPDQVVHHFHADADADALPVASATITTVVTITTAVAAETPPPAAATTLPSQQAAPPQATRDPMCEGFPDTSNILLVMKTGATESFDKLPVQLMTALKCLPDFLLFSDLDQRIGGYHVRDSLETVLDAAKVDNGDFDLYRLQQQCAVDQDNCVKSKEGADSAGWNLDKYKNIHMAEKTYRARPNYDWYLFVDADTYVSWPNLAYALGKLDPSEEKYLGVVTLIGTMTFGHGGSGYIVSQAAMKNFVGNNPGIANKYDIETQNNCCGDYMFAVALNDTTGVLVEDFWPISNGEKPFTAPYGPNAWCQPVGMMHHMNSEETSLFWEFERLRYRQDKTPLVFKEVFEAIVYPRLQSNRDDWDNFSDDWYYIDFDRPEYEWEDWRVGKSVLEERKTETEKKAHENWENCQAACLEHELCLQYFWHNEVCAFHSSIRLGTPRKPSEDETQRYISGWNLPKIDEWLAQNGDCEGRVDWPYQVRVAMGQEEAAEEPGVALEEAGGVEEEEKEEQEEEEEEEEEWEEPHS